MVNGVAISSAKPFDMVSCFRIAIISKTIPVVKVAITLLILLVLYWLINTIFEGFGLIPDINNVATENDMHYLFEIAEK